MLLQWACNDESYIMWQLPQAHVDVIMANTDTLLDASKKPNPETTQLFMARRQNAEWKS